MGKLKLRFEVVPRLALGRRIGFQRLRARADWTRDREVALILDAGTDS